MKEQGQTTYSIPSRCMLVSSCCFFIFFKALIDPFSVSCPPDCVLLLASHYYCAPRPSDTVAQPASALGRLPLLLHLRHITMAADAEPTQATGLLGRGHGLGLRLAARSGSPSMPLGHKDAGLVRALL